MAMTKEMKASGILKEIKIFIKQISKNEARIPYWSQVNLENLEKHYNLG